MHSSEGRLSTAVHRRTTAQWESEPQRSSRATSGGNASNGDDLRRSADLTTSQASLETLGLSVSSDILLEFPNDEEGDDCGCESSVAIIATGLHVRGHLGSHARIFCGLPGSRARRRPGISSYTLILCLCRHIMNTQGRCHTENDGIQKRVHRRPGRRAMVR